MNPNPPEVVTQGDRQAAAEYLAALVPSMPLLTEVVRNGQSVLARAFARHRLRHTPDREAVARVIDPSAWKMQDGYWIEQAHSDVALAKADAIIALIEGDGAL